MAKSLFLIDGHALVFRAFYAVEGLTAPDGRPTGAVLGFTRMLQKTLAEQEPDYIVALFDAPGKTFRHERFPDYKATRKPTPPELKEQVPLIQEVVKGYRIPILSLPGYEADDAIGALAVQGAKKGLEVVIVSGDKDCGQLLNERVRLYDPQKDRWTSAADFVEKRGIQPKQLPDVMGLWGDSSDNIPGVPGIGEKIGIQLIQQYGSLEGLLEKADEVKGKRGEKLRENADLARLSKELATIDIDAPAALDLEAAERRQPDTEALTHVFEDLGFRRQLQELESTKPHREAETRDYVCVDTGEKFAAFLKALGHEERFAIDTETTSLDPMRAALVGISISWAERSAFYLPFQGPTGDPESLVDEGAAPVLSREHLERLKPILENDEIAKTGQNLKYDILVLKRAGVELRGVAFDSLLAASLLPGAGNDLDSLAERYLGVTKIPTKDLIGSGKKQIPMNEVPVDKVCEYACEDADVAWRLEAILRKELEAAGKTALLQELELPLSAVLTEIQATGIRVDAGLLKRQSDECGVVIESLEAEIHEMASKEFNIASPKQLGQILFEEMGLPVIRKTKTGPSTDEAVLTELAHQGHELPQRILDYRMYTKLKSTYLDALPKLIHPETGRIHTTLSQTTTATGRLASSNPNLQNIPIRTDKGRAIRAAFVPEAGWRMLAADYSQVELRMLAHLSGAASLRQAFAEGRDIHRVVAAEVNGIEEEEVTGDQRAAAKAVNFGIIYGQTAHGLAQTTGMSQGEAKLFIDAYFEQFPEVKSYIDDKIFEARERGWVETMLGRHRQIPELKSSNKQRLARAEREAFNTIIQGSAADLIKTAMIELRGRMRRETPRARMLLQIHDELVFEAPPEEIDILQAVVREEMEQAMELAVPLVVDMGVGGNWLEVK